MRSRDDRPPGDCGIPALTRESESALTLPDAVSLVIEALYEGPVVAPCSALVHGHTKPAGMVRNRRLAETQLAGRGCSRKPASQQSLDRVAGPNGGSRSFVGGGR